MMRCNKITEFTLYDSNLSHTQSTVDMEVSGQFQTTSVFRLTVGLYIIILDAINGFLIHIYRDRLVSIVVELSWKEIFNNSSVEEKGKSDGHSSLYAGYNPSIL